MMPMAMSASLLSTHTPPQQQAVPAVQLWQTTQPTRQAEQTEAETTGLPQQTNLAQFIPKKPVLVAAAGATILSPSPNQCGATIARRLGTCHVIAQTLGRWRLATFAATSAISAGIARTSSVSIVGRQVIDLTCAAGRVSDGLTGASAAKPKVIQNGSVTVSGGSTGGPPTRHR